MHVWSQCNLQMNTNFSIMAQSLFWKTSTFATKERYWEQAYWWNIDHFSRNLFSTKLMVTVQGCFLLKGKAALLPFLKKVTDLHIFLARTDWLFGESRTTDWLTGCLFTVQGCLRLLRKAFFCLLRSALILCNALATWDESYSFFNWNWLELRMSEILRKCLTKIPYQQV